MTQAEPSINFKCPGSCEMDVQLDGDGDLYVAVMNDTMSALYLNRLQALELRDWLVKVLPASAQETRTEPVEGVVPGSNLEQQINLARAEIATWPESVKRAMGIEKVPPVEGATSPTGVLTAVPEACRQDVGFGFTCRRARGHAGFCTHSPKLLLGEEPV